MWILQKLNTHCIKRAVQSARLLQILVAAIYVIWTHGFWEQQSMKHHASCGMPVSAQKPCAQNHMFVLYTRC
jgi:hypothetical protein